MTEKWNEIEYRMKDRWKEEKEMYGKRYAIKYILKGVEDNRKGKLGRRTGWKDQSDDKLKIKTVKDGASSRKIKEKKKDRIYNRIRTITIRGDGLRKLVQKNNFKSTQDERIWQLVRQESVMTTMKLRHLRRNN